MSSPTSCAGRDLHGRAAERRGDGVRLQALGGQQRVEAELLAVEGGDHPDADHRELALLRRRAVGT